MASRWFNLLMGVALIQGIVTFSPIPEMQDLDDEWVKFNQKLEDPNFRLPETTKPRHYEVLLAPYLNNPPQGIQAFTFDGEVKIYISATQAGVSKIVLHCNDLSIHNLTVSYINAARESVPVALAPDQDFVCESATSFLTIDTVEALTDSREYVITSTFTGNLQTNMRGFYRSWYRDSTNATNGIRWMATTQFQPGHARQAFPCYDEPSFKATFDISINRDASLNPTISNMPIISNTTDTVNQRVTEHFYTTPKTSTYLLAFIVSNYIVVSNNNDTTRPFTIHARDNVDNHGDWSRDVGERLLTVMENYTGIPYYEMAPYMTMQQAAIPDFSAGAMENWGLLTYREALILYDPENSNHFYKQRVANIVAHEIAHMWFGNLVTCAWWDNLWLNEGFARFYQYFLTEMVEPEFGFETRFVVEQIHLAMLSDSTDAAHPLTDPTVASPTQVSSHFSTITYARGAAVLRMTQYLLGKETYEKGLRSYLADRKFNVAEPSHLFTALDNAARQDNALTAYGNITIAKYFKTWSEQAGHPVVTVSINQQTGRMTITQARWERSVGFSAYPSLYEIPLTWTREGAVDFTNLKPSRIMVEQVETIDRETTGLEWVLFNKQQSGFYRINYDDTNWILLTRALRINKNVIHEYNRAQIVDDLFVFARASVMPYSRAFNILSYLKFEDDYAPWLAAITGFNFAIRRLAHDDSQLQALNELIIDLSETVVNHLGFTEPANEAFMTSMKRMYVMSFLCNVGHEACITAARTNFANWKTGVSMLKYKYKSNKWIRSAIANFVRDWCLKNVHKNLYYRSPGPTLIPANMRPWVYCAGLRSGDASDFDFLWNKYLTEDLAGEQVILITAAGCTTDTASLGKFWEAITTETDDVIIRGQDLSVALNSAITSNEENTMKSFEWLKANLERANSTIGLQSPLNSIISRLLNEQQITEVSTWLNDNRAILGEGVYATGTNAIATARSNIAWHQQRAPEFASFFETGYVEQEIETGGNESGGEEEGGGGDGEGEEEGGDAGGSANIAALSVITLIATLVINFLA